MISAVGVTVGTGGDGTEVGRAKRGVWGEGPEEYDVGVLVTEKDLQREWRESRDESTVEEAPR